MYLNSSFVDDKTKMRLESHFTFARFEPRDRLLYGHYFESKIKAMAYQYRSLKKQDLEFRLLQLLPRTESTEGPLRCRMKHVSLRKIKFSDQHGAPRMFKSLKKPRVSKARILKTKYEAISYTWGDPTQSCLIEIDGRSLGLPISSEKALRRMVSRTRKRTVFIDAVCINQNDNAERASQVLLMGDIYRHSQATLVYLGDASETTAQAFANIRLLHQEHLEEVKITQSLEDHLDGKYIEGLKAFTHTHSSTSFRSRCLLQESMGPTAKKKSCNFREKPIDTFHRSFSKPC